MNWLPVFRSLRLLARAIGTAPSPQQTALAVAMGVAVGIMPKGNLLAVVMTVLMCSLRLNLIVALTVAVGVSIVAATADPALDAIGGFLLTADLLEPFWVWWAEQPLAAWWAFNNTVVLGSFVVGITQIVPTWWSSRKLFERVFPRIASAMASSRLHRTWRRLEWGGRLGTLAE